MPQILLEYTDNIVENDLSETLLKVHHILTEQLPAELNTCKSRLSRLENYVIGNGEKDHAFVHLSVDVKKGRAPELLDSVASNLLNILKETFAAASSKLNLQITVAIGELPDVYKKYSA